MCGRTTQEMTWQQIHDLYELTGEAGGEGGNLGPRDNIAPTQQLLFACEPDGGARTIKAGRWWLVPGRAKEVNNKYPTFNARAETVREKPTFRGPFKSRRCLIPANGYYEWKAGADGGKDPWFIHMPDSPLSFAGLWEYNQALDLTSCTIITMPAEGDIAAIHHRMPAVLRHDAWDEWLAGDTSPDDAYGLLGENHGRDLIAYRVSRNVNSSRYAGDDCHEPIRDEAGNIIWLTEPPNLDWAKR